MKKIVSNLLVLAIIIGHGVAANDTAASRMLARQAAMTDVHRQTNGTADYHITGESFVDGVHTITVEMN